MRWLAAAVVGLGLGADAARAGVGPWTLGRDDRSVYVGASYSRFSRIAGGAGWPGSEPIAIGTAVTRLELDATVSYGLLPSAEIELTAGYARAAVGRRDAPGCAGAPLGLCDTVHGVVPVDGRLKVRLLDEYAGAPLSVAAGPTVRFGDHTRPARARITGLGEGQTDLGGFLAAGRAAALGGTWSLAALAEGEGRYRLPVTRVGGRGAPGHEVEGRVEVLVYPRFEVAMGGSAGWVERPGGVDFERTDLTDPDRFTALRTRYLRAGPKLVLRSVGPVSLVVAAEATLISRNAPSDGWSMTVGVAHYRPGAGRPAAE